MRTHRLENGSRRQFLKQSALVTIAFAGLRNVFEFTARGSEVAGTGTLEADPAGVLDLPTGFSYEVFSKAGEQMDDGLFVPGKHDGMGAFGGPGGKTILVRNHEMEAGATRFSPFGRQRSHLSNVDRSKLYDYGNGRRPGLGGTTTLVYDTKEPCCWAC